MDVMMSGREGSATVAGVVLGVDTHLDLHVAVALDQLGRRLGELTVPTTAKGYESLLCWAESFGPVWCAGVEGTGSCGAGLARHLRSAGIAVLEVERPKRRHLRRNGKSDSRARRPRPGLCWPGRKLVCTPTWCCPNTTNAVRSLAKTNSLTTPKRTSTSAPKARPCAAKAATTRKRSIRYAAKPSACNACPLKSRCTKSKKGRWIRRSFEEEYLERVRGHQDTEAYRKAIRKRAVWVEPLFAEAKDWHGSRRFRLRRLEKVNVEALLIAAGQNVKRLLVFGERGPRREAQVAALRPPASNPYEFCGVRKHRNRLSASSEGFSTVHHGPCRATPKP
jgi:hypothetical protein